MQWEMQLKRAHNIIAGRKLFFFCNREGQRENVKEQETVEKEEDANKDNRRKSTGRDIKLPWSCGILRKVKNAKR